MNRHIKKISNYAIAGSMGALVIATLTGCGDNPAESQAQQETQNQSVKKEGAIVTVQEIFNKDTNKSTYKIIDEAPSSTTTVILIDANGTKKILSQEEIDKLVKEEEKRVESGTSALTKSPEEVKDSGGLGLAGTIMASMAGAMVGSYLMNKLMNNQNYQQNRRMSYSSPAVYSRSQSSFSKTRSSAFGSKTSTSSSGLSKTSTTTSTAPKKSGFFGSSKSSTSSKIGFGG
jgi:hypothetical protein